MAAEVMVTMKQCNVTHFWPEDGEPGEPASMIRWVFEAQFTDDKAKYGAVGYGATVEGAIAALWVDYRLIHLAQHRR
jgi:hypothetical protein